MSSLPTYLFLILIAGLVSITILGQRYIDHLERQDIRHIELCRELDCVNPKLRPSKKVL